MFLSYVCEGASHCLSRPNLLLARELFPELRWVVLSAELHATVACLDERLIFDLNHAPSAMDVSGPATVELLLNRNRCLDVHDRDFNHPQITNELTRSIVEFFEMADNCMIPIDQLLRDFRETQSRT